MTSAIEALQHAESQGVRVWIDGSRLLYSPRQAPLDVLDQLRQCKPEIVALLAQSDTAGSQLPNPPELSAGAQRLVDRFVAGQAWLWVVRETLDAEPDAGVGTPLERRYVAYLDTLVSIENTLRFTYPQVEGCARGDLGPCDPLAVVRCLACAYGSPST